MIPKPLACIAVALGMALGLQTRAASPLSPANELKTFQLADSNLTVELVASEPDIRAPVALAWDADGRMFVAEMTDYPNGPVSGRIRLLEDRDGDGRYEHSQIFATNIAFPNGVMPWKNGILVTAAPDIWFLADTNSDGVANVRDKILTGFTEGNQQLRVNGLFWGLDNWIYGANGRSDGEVKWADGAAAGSIRRHDFRFRPGTRQFEAVAGNSQFGMGHDDWGNRFPVFNNIPIRHVVMEEKYIASLPGTEAVPNISPTNDGNRVFAITSPNLLIPQPIGFFTSACGPSIFRGTALPETYRGNYFVCEPVQNVVQRRVLKPSGSTFIADYAEEGGARRSARAELDGDEPRARSDAPHREFLASSDPWFHGVFTATGPDGAFYIVDMYRDLVEHPHWVAPELRDKVDWRKGEEHGRIWRVRARDAKLSNAGKLSSATSAQLVEALESRNAWTRDTAQRLLVERHATNELRAIKWLTWNAKEPESRVAALHLAAQFTPSDLNTLAWTLNDSDPRVRETSIRLLAPAITAAGFDWSSLPPKALTDLVARTHDPDARVRLQASCLWSRARGAIARRELASFVFDQNLDSWQSIVIAAGIRENGRAFDILQNDFSQLIDRGTPEQLALLQRLAAFLGEQGVKANHEFTNWVAQLKSPNRLLLLASFLEARVPAGRKSSAAVIATDELLARIRSHDDEAVSLAALRIAAGHAEASGIMGACVPLLGGERTEALQLALAKACMDVNDRELARAVFARWPACSRVVRRKIIALGSANAKAAVALLDAVSRGAIPLVEVDANTRQALQKQGDPEVQERAKKVFAASVSADRQEVIEKYRPALTLSADRSRGAAVFEKNCTMCHQMQGIGAKVGPDLSGVGQQPRETLLVQILDPSSAVLPDYVAYTANTKDDESYTGFLVSESADSVTLRRPNEPDITLRRSALTGMVTNGKSIMPDGLEAAITIQDMADLLEFLRRPDRTLFTQSK